MACSLVFAQLRSGLALADWGVIAAYFLLLIVTGVVFSRREQRGTGDYFLAGRRMPMWAVAVSIIATALSAATFIGGPQQAYTGDLTYLSANLGVVLAVGVVAAFFIPVYYRENVTTVYELLERRYGEGAKFAASAAFMVGRVFASGARVYIASLPLALILFGDPAGRGGSPIPEWQLVLGIVALCAVAVGYTLVGGIASVIWTDVIQTAVLLTAVVAVLALLLWKIPVGLPEIVETLRAAPVDGGAATSKLAVFRLGIGPEGGYDFGAKYTVLTAVLGFSLLNLAAYGTDHDLAQRMLTCRGALQGSRSVVLSLAIGIPLTAMFMGVGLLLYVFYRRPDVMGGSAPGYDPGESREVFLTFILREMPAGMSGLMIAGLFAVGIGSLNSAINAMSATFVKDFYTRLAPGRGERHYLAVGRVAVVGWGVVLAACAIGCVRWQRENPGTTLIDLALGVMTFAYAGLLAVFLTAIFTRRGSTASVVAALVTGFCVVGLLQRPVWEAWAPRVPGIGGWLAGVELAFPWHMTIATGIATGVCLLGNRPARRAGPPEHRCEMCGYLLSGVAGDRCPECGAAPGTAGQPGPSPVHGRGS